MDLGQLVHLVKLVIHYHETSGRSYDTTVELSDRSTFRRNPHSVIGKWSVVLEGWGGGRGEMTYLHSTRLWENQVIYNSVIQTLSNIITWYECSETKMDLI